MTVYDALAGVLYEKGHGLLSAAEQLRRYQPTDPLPPHRLLQMANPVLGHAEELEEASHRLMAFLSRRPHV